MQAAVKRVERELEIESGKHIDLTYRACIIAFHRFYGWGYKRIEKFVNELTECYKQVGTNDISMVQLLDEETGIELQNGDGKHWYDLPYLNAKKADGKPMSVEKFIYMRQQQKKWLKPQLIASILLTMHRLYGWSTERDLKLLEQINEVEAEYKSDPRALEGALRKETGLFFRRTGIEVKIDKLEKLYE